MRVCIDDIKGTVLRDNETYKVTDNTFLSNLTLSETVLHPPHRKTTGHSHAGLEEVYFITAGYGFMTLNEDTFPIYTGDVILIKEGVFHQVSNGSRSKDLVFRCVFQKYNRDE